METILTPRLALVQTPIHVLETRLQRDDFVAEVTIQGAATPVAFPREWPGDALPVLPMILGMQSDPGGVTWGGTIILLGENVAIGMMGCMQRLPRRGGGRRDRLRAQRTLLEPGVRDGDSFGVRDVAARAPRSEAGRPGLRAR